MIKTKIIATLGPSCNKPETIESMIDKNIKFRTRTAPSRNCRDG